MRKIISILAALMSLLPISVSAQIVNQPVDYDFVYDWVYYRVIPKTNTVEICGATPVAVDVVIPDNIMISVSGENPVPYEVVGFSPFAFLGQKGLKSVKFSETITGVEMSVFSGCTNLENIELSHSIRYIRQNPFYNTALETLAIPATNGDLEVNKGAFNGMKKLKKLIFEDCGYSVMGEYEKENPGDDPSEYIPYRPSILNLEEVYIGRTINYLSLNLCQNIRELTTGGKDISIPQAFMSGCKKLASVTISDGVSAIGREAFKDCTSLEKLYIGNGLSDIPQAFMSGCKKLASVTIPDGVSFIGREAFKDCTSLEKLYIGNGLKYLGFYYGDLRGPGKESDNDCGSFKGCSSLKYIECSAENPPRGDEFTFKGVPVHECVLVVPLQSVDKYKDSSTWGVFKNIKGKDFSVTGIENVAEDDAISFNSGLLTSWKDGLSLAVYSVDGRQVVSRVLSQGESIELPGRGIYIVVANGKFHKIAY